FAVSSVHRLTLVAVALLVFEAVPAQTPDRPTPPQGEARPPGGGPQNPGEGGPGRFRRQMTPMTPEEEASVAKLASLPNWDSNAASGDFSIAPPYAPSPETVAQEGVPKGRVESFTMNLADSQFKTPDG